MNVHFCILFLVHVEGVVEYLVKVFLVEVVFAISLEDSPSVVRG